MDYDPPAGSPPVSGTTSISGCRATTGSTTSCPHLPGRATRTGYFGSSENWVECGRLQLPNGYCRQLIVYFDLVGNPVIHAITKVGVYAYDFYTRSFRETPLMWPMTETAGRGACVWRGEPLAPVGASGYRYNGQTIQVISPSKDDGLPAELRGELVSFVPGHAFYYGVLK
ncbi:MAG: hypothetical protein M5T61_09830 [Acidimicrobiia bacterium]|nr:hypothetical protein [Acidimicrobiia bacterium]